MHKKNPNFNVTCTTFWPTLHHLVSKKAKRKKSISPYCISEVIIHKDHLQELSQHAVGVCPSCSVTAESETSEQLQWLAVEIILWNLVLLVHLEKNRVQRVQWGGGGGSPGWRSSNGSGSALWYSPVSCSISSDILHQAHRRETVSTCDVKHPHTDGIHWCLQSDSVLHESITANLLRMDTICSVGPRCASCHSSSNVERSALESTAMATAMAADTAADTALDIADVRAAVMAADDSSSEEDIAACRRRGTGSYFSSSVFWK